MFTRENIGEVMSGPESAGKLLKHRELYLGLIENLGHIGTPVLCDRAVESGFDTFPYSFVIKATHKFVFPEQPGIELFDTGQSGKFYGASPYSFTMEVTEAPFDPGLVQGSIEVSYIEGAPNGNIMPAPKLTATGAFEGLAPPEEALAALDVAFPSS